MARGREPAAWVNAARMDKDFDGVYFYVEGVSDESFWKKFVNRDVVHICVCDGCENVISTIEHHQKQNVKKYLGVIDRDFRDILETIPDNHNIVVTDFHDIEMMMYLSDAFRNLIVAIDKNNKLEEYEKNYGGILNHVLELTDRIGHVKLASKLKGDILEFRREKDYELVVPKYEGMIDKDGEYLDDSRLARIINVFSSQNRTLTRIDDSEIVNMINEVPDREIDSSILSNGHDVSYLMPYVLRRKCKFNKSGLDSSMIDSLLMAAYSKEMFHSSMLYKAIELWSTSAGVNMFL